MELLKVRKCSVIELFIFSDVSLYVSFERCQVEALGVATWPRKSMSMTVKTFVSILLYMYHLRNFTKTISHLSVGENR